MDEFFENINSSNWWLSVVVVGIAVNLFSRLLENLGSGFIKSRKNARKRDSQKKKSSIARAVVDNVFYSDIKFGVLLYSQLLIFFGTLSLLANNLLIQTISLGAAIAVLRHWSWFFDVFLAAVKQRK